jgi:hypothetical protein
VAYANSNPICRLGPQNSNAPTLWSYADGDALATIDGSGYFNDESDKLQVGDFIFIAASDGYGISVVNANSSGVVDTTNATAVATIDSD